MFRWPWMRDQAAPHPEEVIPTTELEAGLAPNVRAFPRLYRARARKADRTAAWILRFIWIALSVGLLVYWLAPPLISWADQRFLTTTDRATVVAERSRLQDQQRKSFGNLVVVLNTSLVTQFSWERQRLGDTGLIAVDFVDEQHGWVLSRDGIVSATRDGGENWWVQLESGPGPRTAMHVAEPGRGWVLGPGGSVATEDGGRNWRPLYPWWSAKVPGHEEAGWIRYIVPEAPGGPLVFARKGLFRLANGYLDKVLGQQEAGSTWLIVLEAPLSRMRVP